VVAKAALPYHDNHPLATLETNRRRNDLEVIDMEDGFA